MMSSFIENNLGLSIQSNTKLLPHYVTRGVGEMLLRVGKGLCPMQLGT
jgi:hypothetical protein